MNEKNVLMYYFRNVNMSNTLAYFTTVKCFLGQVRNLIRVQAKKVADTNLQSLQVFLKTNFGKYDKTFLPLSSAFP
jgi:hypothetical protein